MEHRVDLPWHLAGRLDIRASGQLVAGGDFQRVRERSGAPCPRGRGSDHGGRVARPWCSAPVAQPKSLGPSRRDRPVPARRHSSSFGAEGRTSRLVSVLGATRPTSGSTVNCRGNPWRRHRRHRPVVDGWETQTAGGEVGAPRRTEAPAARLRAAGQSGSAPPAERHRRPGGGGHPHSMLPWTDSIARRRWPWTTKTSTAAARSRTPGPRNSRAVAIGELGRRRALSRDRGGQAGHHAPRRRRSAPPARQRA